MPAAMAGNGHRAAGGFEIWAARAWNVFNEGRPFSIVFPVMVLLCSVPVGLAPDGSLLLALGGTLALAVVVSRFSFPLRSRALLWLVALASHPAARAVARGAAPARRARRLPLLHRRPLGLDLLPPAHRRAVDQRAALLAARAHQLGPHQRQRAGAGAEVRDDHQRRQPAGRGRRPRLGGLDRGGRRAGGGHGHAGVALVRAHAAAPLPRAAARRPAPTAHRPPRVRDRGGRGQPRAHVAGGHAGHGPPRARGHRVPGRGARLPRPHRGLLLLDAHRLLAGRARDAIELRPPPGRAHGVGVRRARVARVARAGSWGSPTSSTRSARTWSGP